ncbi:MAG: FKBP-type peptidyl-prolyl cis-trans isomerase [Rikenellaceae bacterium]|jgi:FKBP-type peptidyl-prolyl cis-trans isomerase|nr:FKBP-type peptidyl-prolyl cis-trans isomerase [Rikenellaceae bacterium]
MKNVMFFAALVVAVMFSSCGSSGGGRELKTEADSLAYVIGLNVGYNLKYNTDSTLDVEMLCAAIRDTYSGTQKMDMEQAGAFYRQYHNIVKPRRTKAASEEFLTRVQRENSAVKSTDSGLLYLIEEQGDTIRASKPADQVKILYRATTKEGAEFETTYDDNEAETFALNQVVKGLSEGLKMVGQGGKIKLWMPATLGYGSTGNKKIGANEALCFEVEVVEVIPTKEEKEQ